MSIIKDISESHEQLKCVAISLLAMPLWYLSMFFIHPSLFEKTDLIFKIVFCGVNSIIPIFLLSMLVQKIDGNKNIELVESTIISTFLYFIFKSLYLAVTFIVLWFSEREMYYLFYVIGSYSVFIVVMVITFVDEKLSKK